MRRPDWLVGDPSAEQALDGIGEVLLVGEGAPHPGGHALVDEGSRVGYRIGAHGGAPDLAPVAEAVFDGSGEPPAPVVREPGGPPGSATVGAREVRPANPRRS
ncbi:hypothetical protein [Saccharothrix xinjiangensis]|uniref:hypothetical protein n=1 Tax=Saccharothrix xinjiangensis TaxID=204798 RepID=UPI0031E02568